MKAYHQLVSGSTHIAVLLHFLVAYKRSRDRLEKLHLTVGTYRRG